MVGKGLNCPTSQAIPTPSPMPASPPTAAHENRFDKELAEDIEIARSDRFADADFPRSFRDGDQHDIHNADAADQYRYSAHGSEQDRERRSCGAKRVDEQRLVLDHHIIRPAGLDFVAR